MKHPPRLTAVLAIPLFVLLLSSSTDAHNITKILAKHPEFSTFNHYLTITHLAAEINRRLTITVLAVDNAGMAPLLAKHLSTGTIKNVLSLHVLVDYFGAKKLHQITNGTTLTSTMFQASGDATGTAGYVNITDLKAGKVGFGSEDGGELTAHFVKSVQEIPYNISILQISQALTSSEAEAPTASPSEINITSIMTKQGCKAFGELIRSSGAEKTFQENMEGGLTVFCATDSVVNKFMPKYKNLTAPQKESLMLYHGMPFYSTLQMLKSSNGLTNTLATNGAKKFDFTVQNDGEDVMLETKVVTAKVIGTVIDEDPVVIYKLDKVLEPKELFKAEEAPAPKASKKEDTSADGPAADSPESDSADQTADDNSNGVDGLNGGKLVALFMSFCLWVIFR